MSIKFEGYERRINKINACLAEYGMSSLEEARDVCLAKGVNPEEIVRSIQPIAFENAVWAYTLGAAIARRGYRNQKRLQASGGRRRSNRYRLASILHPRFGCGPKTSWSWPR